MTATICARCRKPMACNPGGPCWCEDWPRLKLPVRTETCLCPACLGEAMIAARPAPPLPSRE